MNKKTIELLKDLVNYQYYEYPENFRKRAREILGSVNLTIQHNTTDNTKSKEKVCIDCGRIFTSINNIQCFECWTASYLP